MAAEVRVLFCGVRGSTPSPGVEFAGIGGNTSCVALAHAGAAPTLALDAGTGLRRLTTFLEGEPFRGTILLGHLHWDHTHGLPFFAAGDRDDARVHLAVPAQGDGVTAVDLLARAMSPPHFPIRPDQLRGDWSFAMIDEGEHRVEGFDVLAREIPHKGGRTFGYRVSEPGGPAIAYLSDHAPQDLGGGEHGLGELHPAALELARGVDVLIHDAQYTTDELVTRRRFGHSPADYAALLGVAAGAKHILLFHHEPNRVDEQVVALGRAVAARYPQASVDVATEGMVIEL